MFRRNKHENKAKLEHKLYLARECPEPVFDLSDCELRSVPQGIYSLCKVFLKEVLRLNHNCLTNLSGGGHLHDLHLLKILDLSWNHFSHLPEEIYLLKNLKELYINNNQIKKLPTTICNLSNLRVLNVAYNSIKHLPENFGELQNLNTLHLNNNRLHELPKSMCKNQKLIQFTIDEEHFKYPPTEIIQQGPEVIIKYLCDDVGIEYSPPDETECDNSIKCDSETVDATDSFEAKIRTLENIKKQKVQDFLEIEKANEILQKQEFEMANAQKLSREKLLADISQQQTKFDLELSKIQQIKELDRFRLIEQLQEAEQNADIAIQQLLMLNREPQAHLLEQEKKEEERLLAAANRYNETLRTNDILADMQDLLQQETSRFERFHQDRMEISQSILEQEIESHDRLGQILQDQDLHKAEMVSRLLIDSDLQKAAVGTLLERGDARSWGLVQQIRLVEGQLAALTSIEMDKRKLQIDHHLNDLAEKRVNLSILLMDLLELQRERRTQLLSTLQILEENEASNVEYFWLIQYQRLLDKLPQGLSEAQKNMDPVLAETLLANGVINCVPFLAKITQAQCDVEQISEDDLIAAGVVNKSDRLHILDAFQMYKKQKSITMPYVPTAPVIPVEEASAPLPEQLSLTATTECVICMDHECQIIYVPCGHFCCCLNCSRNIDECPLCRANIEHKVRIIIS